MSKLLSLSMSLVFFNYPCRKDRNRETEIEYNDKAFVPWFVSRCTSDEKLKIIIENVRRS